MAVAQDRPPSEPAAVPILELRDLSKRFGGIAALSSASLTLARSSTLALVGENGAGKSTLIKIISGVIRPDSGTMAVDGVQVSFATPAEATASGIATVYQELSLLPDLSVTENLVLGSYPKRSGLISWRRARRQAEAELSELGLTLPLDAPVSRLGLAEKYLVEIAKAVRVKPRVLILDEPTAALDPHDSERIFLLMDTLRRAGTGIIFVSHRLEELFTTSQTYTVLKDGVTTGSGVMADTSEDDLVAKMLGFSSPRERGRSDRAHDRRVEATVATVGDPDREKILVAESLTSAAIRDVSFGVAPGEIIGIAGLRGSGQTELCRALSGVDRPSSGRLVLRGKVFTPRSPARALANGVGYLPQERKTAGLCLNMSVEENIALSRLVNRSMRWASRRSQRAVAAEYRDSLDIRLPGRRLDTPVSALSGGNQQKVVLARCLAANLSVLVLDEPTRGVDVGAKQQIHDLIVELAAGGMAVVVSSSELDELLGLATRVVVLHRGELAAIVEGEDMNETNIVALASGVAA